MTALTMSKIKKSFGERELFHDIDLSIQDDSHVGLIGSNGAGKTTLLEIIAGNIRPDSGEIKRSKDTRIGYLHQQSGSSSSQLSLWDEAKSCFQALFDIEAQMRLLEDQMGQNTHDLQLYHKTTQQYSLLSDQYKQLDGYAWKSRLTGVLAGLGFSKHQYDQEVHTLSGGEQTRLHLAKLLLSQATLLLLDEPTNHLDLAAVQWLEDYLKAWKGTLVIVSHDRYFLNALCTHIAELSFGNISYYSGNYSAYLPQKEAAFEVRRRSYALQQKEIERQEAIIERYRMYNREKSIRAAESREKALGRIERIERPQREKGIHILFESKRQSGEDVLYAEGIHVCFDQKTVLAGVEMQLKKGDRAAIIGSNGSGKTTLLKALIGQIALDQGKVTLGTNVQIGYYDQMSPLHPDKNILQEVWDDFPKLNQTQIRSALGAFLFRDDDVFKETSVLSGGEKARVLLLKLMLGGYNLLVLDEPTNHLDMPSRESLEAALMAYSGTILAVSHDRFFLNRIANKVYLLHQGVISHYEGNYDAYLTQTRAASLPSPVETTGKQSMDKANLRRGNAAARQQERKRRADIAGMEDRIKKIEREIVDLESMMADPALAADGKNLNRLSEQYGLLCQQRDDLYTQWMEMH